MAEFKLGRIRFVWKDNWTTSTTYYKDDVVKYGAQLFICQIGHSSSNTLETDLLANPTKWNAMTEGQAFVGDWATNTYYKLNDVVKYGGVLYVCNTGHTSAGDINSGLEADAAKWSVYAEGFDWKNEWSTSTRYKLNDIVKYGGYTYICITSHTSSASTATGLEGDLDKWQVYNKGLEYLSTWTEATRYKLNDIVKFGPSLYICTTAHTSTASFVTDLVSYWNIFLEGLTFEGQWDSGTAYQTGNIVTYGGNQYIAQQPSTNQNPYSTSGFWTLFHEGLNWQSDWAITTSYKIGDVVRLNGNTFLALQDLTSLSQTVTASSSVDNTFTVSSTTGFVQGMSVIFSGTTFGNILPTATYYVKTIPTSTTFTISIESGGTEFVPTTASGSMTARISAQPPMAAYWARLTSGMFWKGLWTDDTHYLAGDIVRYGSNTYICVVAHRSEGDDGSTIGAEGGGSSNSRPDQDITGTYWNLLSVGSASEVLTTPGDLLYFGGAGPARLPIGTEGQVLVAGAEYPEWQSLGLADDVYYVSTYGEDNPTPVYGLTFDKPWKTIRYACEQIEKGAKNPNARELLELNRVFIQRETTEYILWQIANAAGGSIWENFVYEDFKCERDIGFTVDALIFDITHGGNVKTRGVANALVGAIVEDSPGAYPNLAAEKDQSIAAYNYMLSLVEKVLNQEAPAVNYQTTNGDNSTATVSQYFNANIAAEPSVYTTALSLVTIITNALEDEDASRVPARYRPFSLVKVSTGRYRETLPIIVPERTCILGDELRSTNIGPSLASTDITDTKYSLQTLNRFESVVSDIVLGNDVTETSGNTAVQSRTWPYADTLESTAIGTLVGALKQNIAFRTGSTSLLSLSDPTGYNSSYLIGYGDARKIIRENKKFFQEQVIAYLTSQFPLVRYSKTICKRDVGYIVDAVVYDLTYGGYTQSINAGLAYFDGPGGALMIDSEEKTATLSAYVYLKSIMQSAANNLTVAPLQISIPQYRGTAGSAASLVAIGTMLDYIYNIINGGTEAAPNVTITTINSNVCTTSAAHGLQVGDSFTSRYTANNFVKDRKYWIVSVPAANTFTVSESFGGSTLTLTNGTGLNIVGDIIDYPVATDGVTSTTALITAAETLDAAQETIIQNVIDDLNTVAWHTDFVVSDSGLTNDDFIVYVGKDNLSFTYVTGGIVTKSDETVLFVSNFVYDESTGFATVTTSVDHGLEAGDIVDIENITLTYNTGGNTFNVVFPSGTDTQSNVTKIRYIQNKCIRDIRIILESVMFDFMFNSNYQTTKAAFSYLRSSASEVFSLGQKTITRDALSNAKTEALSNVGGDSTAQTRISILMELLDDVIYSGSNEGDNCATGIRNRDYAVLQLERNRNYIVSEMSAYISETFKDTVTATTASTSTFTISDTSWLQRNTAIRFSGTLIENSDVESDTTYYVQDIVSATEFTIAGTRFATSPQGVEDDTGSMTVSLYYNQALCERDIQRYIDAIKYDLKYPGNYASLLAARYYSNSVNGNLEEDCYYLRDSTGVRDQTLEGLTGDLLSDNEYGTARVSAGAYCSLDPGWGPEDYRAWIIDRSPYVQNVSTLGTACVGQKIDGALHNGGNDSIVSNDFTQVLSDGIGAWVANNGRAELVSVFTYYCHIGYLSTEGGRIRGTNGNNSYGDFGAVAEGVDSTETPGTAVVDNRAFEAQIESSFTDGSQIFTFEFSNAGSEYTEATWEITGGLNADVLQDEFRDDAVFQVRLLDLGDDSSGQFGGDGYITSASTAQGGTSTSITLAATDGQPSTAYVGMKVIITGGTGVGQFGIISSYNSGTKIANVTRNTGVSGWDYFLTGVPQSELVSPDASSTYAIEPNLTFTDPGFNATYSAVPSSGDWSDCVYGDTFVTYNSLTGTYPGSGSDATFTVIRNGSKYITSLASAGTGYSRLETITIAGTSLGGLSTTNDLTITITSVNTSTGAILDFETVGFGIGGTFVAVRSGSQVGATSSNGESWTNVATMMPSAAAWSGLAHGVFEDGSTFEKVGRFVAVSSTSSTSAAYSADGSTWSASVLPASAEWNSVAFGAGKFVAIASDNTTVAISQDGEFWDTTGTLPSTGFNAVTYGKGVFVAVKAGTTGAAAYSTDGVAWTAVAMPANSTWIDVTYGNNTFVAVATDSNSGAVSVDGNTWQTITIGSADGSSVSGFQNVKYGQGLFVTTAYLASSEDYSFVATSSNAVDWTIRGVDLPGSQQNNFSGWKSLAFGNPQRVGKWALIEYSTGDAAVFVRTGAPARARAVLAENKVFVVTLTEPGSGYNSTPVLTITDPNNTFDFPHEVRTGKGVLANPTFLNRGTQYVTGNATITGDGYADIYQTGGFIAVKRLSQRPVPGSNVVFDGVSQTFKLVNVVSFLGSNDGSYTAFFQVSPTFTATSSPEHETTLITRIRYSQVRLTGHDFLDIGTGNFTETNYPGAPISDPITANEIKENNGGRVFFTSTDQDGNFRVGNLFSIEQSTGIATLNADAFNIAGLQELNLGNVTLGGNSATITEFSTDPFFTADSDNIVPTQRAIKAYISAQIGGGGASLNVNSVTAGSIIVAGNSISHVSDGIIFINARTDFKKTVTGIPLALGYYLR